MMLKLAERQKGIVENMKRDKELFSEAQNMPYFSLLHQQKPVLSSSPPSGLSLQSSEYSPSSSLSNGFCSSEDGSPYAAPPFEAAKYQSPSSLYLNGLCLDSKSPHNSHNIRAKLVDELGLSQHLYRMNIREEHIGVTKMKGFEMDPDGFGLGFDGSSFGGNVQYDIKRYGSYDGFNNGGLGIEGTQSSRGVSLSFDDDVNATFNGFQGRFEKGVCDSMRSLLAHNPCNEVCSGCGWYDDQADYPFAQRKEQGRSWCNRGNASGTRPCLNDALARFQQYKMDSSGGRGVMVPLSSPRLKHPVLDLNVYDPFNRSSIVNERTGAITNNGGPQSLMSMRGAGDLEAFSCEDGFTIRGKGLNHVSNRGRDPAGDEISVKNLHGKTIKPDSCILNERICESGQSISTCVPLPVIPSFSSLAEGQDYIYLMAQDQNGCRFLQRIFAEGTSQDVQIIFNEIVGHVVELMLKPFGNYVIQKLLDVCSEEQKLQIVHMVTQKQGQLVRICLNTYGTRVVQKLIETLKTREQISLVVSNLKPGFLELITDQNGNHVIQRCLQCLSNEDNKFIFNAAAKSCVQIATHRHGCCVMQRCIAHATGKHHDKLITEISRNSLHLAQDPYGNYVVQYIIELKSSSIIGNLPCLFKGHYVHLSMQKFSSHVVEKCLKHFEESRSQIVGELLSVSHFEQLLQDPFANYVIQCALAVTKGPLHSALVDAVRPHMILRTSPYCKRIFSRNLLKK